METTRKTIIFIFAGREKYLEILRKYLLVILRDNNDIELHLWNFCRNARDNLYVRRLATELPRTTIFNDHYEGENINETCIKQAGVICNCVKCRVGKWTEPYKYYADNPIFANYNFIKLDDDILFVDTSKIGNFIDRIERSHNKILTANVINNGICAMKNDQIGRLVRERRLLDAVNPKKKRTIRARLKNTRLYKSITKKDAESETDQCERCGRQ